MYKLRTVFPANFLTSPRVNAPENGCQSYADDKGGEGNADGYLSRNSYNDHLRAGRIVRTVAAARRRRH